MTIASEDAVNMHPSIKLATIRNAVIFSARKINVAAKKTIELCLKLIGFGMISSLTSFGREYYEYHSGKNKIKG